MGALDQIANLLRDARQDLTADLARMDRIDEMRAERDELTYTADDHDLMAATGDGDATIHRLIAKQLREKAATVQRNIDLIMRAGRITQEMLAERDAAQRAIQWRAPIQHWSRTAGAWSACGDRSPFRIDETGYCIDAPEHIPAGSCMWGDDDCETLIERGAA
jgi:hypothetical protein